MIEAPLDVRYDKEWDIVHIDDARFAGDFFRRLRLAKPGDHLELIAVQPGKMSIKILPRGVVA